MLRLFQYFISTRTSLGLSICVTGDRMLIFPLTDPPDKAKKAPTHYYLLKTVTCDPSVTPPDSGHRVERWPSNDLPFTITWPKSDWGGLGAERKEGRKHSAYVGTLSRPYQVTTTWCWSKAESLQIRDRPLALFIASCPLENPACMISCGSFKVGWGAE